MRKKDDKITENLTKTQPLKEINLLLVTQSPIVKAYIFRFKSLFHFAYRNIKNHKIQRKKRRVFRIWKCYAKKGYWTYDSDIK